MYHAVFLLIWNSRGTTEGVSKFYALISIYPSAKKALKVQCANVLGKPA